VNIKDDMLQVVDTIRDKGFTATVDNVKIEAIIRRIVGNGFRLKRQNGNVYEFEPLRYRAFWL